MPASPKGASLVITIHPELGFTSYMAITTLQQVIDERISFLKEQINPRIRYNYTKKTTMLMYNALRNHPLLKESWTVLIKEGLRMTILLRHSRLQKKVLGSLSL